jgi:TolA-binding protein
MPEGVLFEPEEPVTWQGKGDYHYAYTPGDPDKGRPATITLHGGRRGPVPITIREGGRNDRFFQAIMQEYQELEQGQGLGQYIPARQYAKERPASTNEVVSTVAHDLVEQPALPGVQEQAEPAAPTQEAALPPLSQPVTQDQAASIRSFLGDTAPTQQPVPSPSQPVTQDQAASIRSFLGDTAPTQQPVPSLSQPVTQDQAASVRSFLGDTAPTPAPAPTPVRPVPQTRDDVVLGDFARDLATGGIFDVRDSINEAARETRGPALDHYRLAISALQDGDYARAIQHADLMAEADRRRSGVASGIRNTAQNLAALEAQPPSVEREPGESPLTAEEMAPPESPLTAEEMAPTKPAKRQAPRSAFESPLTAEEMAPPAPAPEPAPAPAKPAKRQAPRSVFEPAPEPTPTRNAVLDSFAQQFYPTQPTAPTGNLALARQALEAGNYDEALRYADLMVKEDPSKQREADSIRQTVNLARMGAQ